MSVNAALTNYDFAELVYKSADPLVSTNHSYVSLDPAESRSLRLITNQYQLHAYLVQEIDSRSPSPCTWALPTHEMTLT